MTRPSMHPFHAHVAAALEGLRDLPLADLEPGALLVALTVLGDALRLGLDVPSPVRRAADAVSENAIRAALADFRAETDLWALPVEPGPEEETPGYDWAVRQRDEAESVVLAARRILTPRGVLLDEFEEARAFADAIARFDFTCGGRRGREDAERALGDRLKLATRGSWLDTLPDREGEPIEHADLDADVALPFAAPSDEAVDLYITRGELVAFVESAARRSAAFAEELEAMIEAGIACRSTVGLVARRWLRSYKARDLRNAPATPISIAVGAMVRYAAADHDAELAQEPDTLALGALHPLDALASLTILGNRATLTITPTPDLALTLVRLGGEVATAPDAEGFWRVTTPITSDALELHIEATDGRSFRDMLAFEPAS